MTTRLRVAALLAIVLAGALPLAAEAPQRDPAAAVMNPEPAAGGSQYVVPRFIKFSGTLLDMASKPITGVTDVSFALYTEEAGGTALWYESQTIEADALGRYTVLLGAMHANGVPVELFTSGEARWLGVEVGNLPETAQGGRVLLVSVPYALKAMDAETLGGKPASAYMLAPTESAPEPVQTGNPTTPGAPSTNLIGKGGKTRPKPLTSTPATTFADTTTNQVVLVTQNGTGLGLLATAPSNTALEGVTSGTGTTTFGGVYGLSNGATGAGKGVIGQSNSTTGVGVYALETATTGLSYGLLATAKSTSGVGIQGQATATTGNTIGLFGLDYSTSGIGLSGQNNAVGGTTVGVQAKVFSFDGTAMVVDNTAGGKIASFRNNGVVKLSLDGSGNLVASGAVTATSFAGTGAALTNLTAGNLVGTVPNIALSGQYGNQLNFSHPMNSFTGNGSGLTGVTASGLTCAGCIGNTQLGVNYAGSASQGGAATNSLALGGVAPSGYATIGANSFVGNQSVTGNVTVSGVLSGNTLGVGTTTPLFPIHVIRTDSTGVGVQVRITNPSTTSNSLATFSLEANGGAVVNQFAIDGLGTGPLGQPGGYLGTFSSHPLALVTGNNVRLRISTNGNVGINTSNTGDGELAVDSGSTTAAALAIERGSIRVVGAGAGTSTPAFIHVVNTAMGGNSCGLANGGDSTFIDNPLTNGDPNAMLIVTANAGNRSAAVFTSSSIDLLHVVYDDNGFCSLGHWVIFSGGAVLGNAAKFNVLVIKP